MKSVGAGCVLTLALFYVPSGARAQDSAHAFLKNVGGFDDKSLARLDAGDVITRVLDTGDENELALMGAAWMEGTTSAFLPM